MMTNDQLTRNERIRLESLSQAHVLTNMTATERPTAEQILTNAEKIETWLKSADLKGTN